MRNKIGILLALFLGLFFTAATAQDDTVNKACLACHANLVSQDVVHDAIKRGCDKCHQPNGQQHPQKDVAGFKLSANIPALCYKCHDENNTGRVVHPPVQKGDCLQCHTPHSSPEANLLKKYPTGEVCLQCHKLESAQKKYKHEPVLKGDCAKCHDPHSSDIDRLLVREIPSLCTKCHKAQGEELKMDNVHPPFRDNCLNCHNQHSSDQPKLLDLTPQNLCVNCHDDMQKKIDKAETVHGAVADSRSCLNCHSPHASAQKRFLLQDTKSLCLSCHNRTMSVGTRKIANIEQTLQKAKSVHGAIDKAGCTGCHDPHASTNPYLLAKSFPSGSYAPATKESFALCFSCHNSEIIEKQTTTTATNFRNGDKNLHVVHVNGEKGRSCILCHNPHGSPNDHLINDRTQFGNWSMQLNYKSTLTGGSCAPGCHALHTYDRTAVIQETVPPAKK